MTSRIGYLTAQIRENNIAKGWRSAAGGPGQNTLGDYLALMISETGEATDAYRKWKLADATDAYDCPPEGCYGVADCANGHSALTKPEGVGSELADVLIRLLDTADVFGFDMTRYTWLADVEHLPPALLDPELPPVVTFGDHMAWVAKRIGKMWTEEHVAVYVLRALVTVARTFSVDLEWECERKMAYNKSRPFHHGGSLSDTNA
jgi:NTP pyrophosphatase (non-canonical NTP hydrolase)